MSSLTFDFENLTQDKLGKGKGLTKAGLKAAMPALDKALKAVEGDRKSGRTTFRQLPYCAKSRKEALGFAGSKAGKFDDLVIVGIGGSGLGFRALFQALSHPNHNLLSKKLRSGRPRVFVLDNADAGQAEGLLDIINPKRTMLVYITKSGATPEPAANLMYFWDKIDRKNLVIIADRKENSINAIAEKESIPFFEVPQGVGGRYSVLSSVGLVPAALAGLDIAGLHSGARAMDALAQTKASKNPVALYALYNYLLDVKQGRNVRIFMPYGSALFDFGLWIAQLWAESLGKKRNRKGKTVNVGTTPVLALGATDQHSTLQLYIEGPHDKMVTMIGAEKGYATGKITASLKGYNEYGYFKGKTISRLLNVERESTAWALAKSGRPNCSILANKVNPSSLGELFMFFEVQTAIQAELYNIDGYDQPGVEAGKNATYCLMGRKGYEGKRTEILRELPDRVK